MCLRGQLLGGSQGVESLVVSLTILRSSGFFVDVLLIVPSRDIILSQDINYEHNWYFLKLGLWVTESVRAICWDGDGA